MSELDNQVVVNDEPVIEAETAPEAGKVIEPTEEVEVIEWDKADLTMVCGNCGTEEKITEAVGGVTLFMNTKSDSETRLVCPNPECGNRMSLLFRNGSFLTDEEKAQLKADYVAAQAKAKAEMKYDKDGVRIDVEPVTEDEPTKESK